jgi:cytochrome b
VSGGTRIWDLPTRLFHWILVLLVVFSVVSAKIGGGWIDWHMRSGYCILTLLLFRLMWGFAGSFHARFANFMRAPAAVLAYARALRGGTAAVQGGHNPLGAWSVLAMLVVVLVQAVAGLFANDSIASEGPLAKFVSGATSDLFTRLHKANQYVIYLLIALHLATIAYYYFARRENLVLPMLTGVKPGAPFEPARDDARLRLRAAVLLAVAAACTAYIVAH